MEHNARLIEIEALVIEPKQTTAIKEIATEASNKQPPISFALIFLLCTSLDPLKILADNFLLLMIPSVQLTYLV